MGNKNICLVFINLLICLVFQFSRMVDFGVYVKNGYFVQRYDFLHVNACYMFELMLLQCKFGSILILCQEVVMVIFFAT